MIGYCRRCMMSRGKPLVGRLAVFPGDARVVRFEVVRILCAASGFEGFLQEFD